MDEVDIQKCRDLRSPHVNALIEANEKLNRKYEQLKNGLFQIQYGAVTISGVHELGVVIREHGEQKLRIQQLLEAMDREVAARRKAEEPSAALEGLFEDQAQRIAALEDENTRMRMGLEMIREFYRQCDPSLTNVHVMELARGALRK